MAYELRSIGELCKIVRKSVNPQNGTQYTVYSLPAFDNNKKPEICYGDEIKSGKLAVIPNSILFNKLNVQFRRVWNIGNHINEHSVSSTEFIPLVVNEGVSKDYLYYNLISDTLTASMFSARKGTSSSQQRISPDALLQYRIPCPPYDIQLKIGAILSVIDRKIETNTEINDNLQEQALSIFRKMFIETSNDSRHNCRADDYFDISIGKTPPRKEPQWFSTDPADRVWVSISDMGSCGVFIADSSEYLTHESVEKFNVKVVPDNTVLLSFKLTVGRVAITDGAMATNEAIAHFKTENDSITEYLYCYLKGFNYQTMGSTSSIATAVNSKIIKAMPFTIPTNEELAEFHAIVAPMFAMIKANQRENSQLAGIRDSLLPRLMSGEIDVSTIEI